MSDPITRLTPWEWNGVTIAPGESREVSIGLSETYTGQTLAIPVFVRRAPEPGPSVFVSAAVHGDEINGTGAVRTLIADGVFELQRGTLILVPVVNLPGFQRHSRYLPDRRDLNRSFPGTRDGSFASRLARAVFTELVGRCDYGIDLHTAAVRRTNFPNVRADMTDPELAGFARAFGCELIVSGKGPDGSLRRSACSAGCKTLILEGGEVWKVEPGVVEYAMRGIENCLKHLRMVEGKPAEPEFRIETDSTKWVRADYGGFLEFHVAPGDTVRAGDAIATNASLMGREQNILTAPRDGVILGMTTLPSVSPGDPVLHLAFTKKGAVTKIEHAPTDEHGLFARTREALSRSIVVTEPAPELLSNPVNDGEIDQASDSDNQTGTSS